MATPTKPEHVGVVYTVRLRRPEDRANVMRWILNLEHHRGIRFEEANSSMPNIVRLHVNVQFDRNIFRQLKSELKDKFRAKLRLVKTPEIQDHPVLVIPA